MEPRAASLESKGVRTVFPRQGVSPFNPCSLPDLLVFLSSLQEVPQHACAFTEPKGTSWTEPPASGVLGCCTCCFPYLESCLPLSPSPFCWLLPTFALRSSSSSTCMRKVFCEVTWSAHASLLSCQGAGHRWLSPTSV